MPQRLPVRVFNGASRLAARLGARPASFAGAEAALLDAARKATGLDDFGDPGFLDGLRVLLEAYEKEARLNPFGRMMVWQQLAGILRSRLSVVDAWKQEPSVLEAPVRRPIFVLGLPRTGTTALHTLLAQDPANQCLDYWLGASPGPRPTADAMRDDPRFKQAARELGITYWLDPGLRAIHDLTPDGPDECRHLLIHHFTDDTFDSNATIPSYTAWFAGRDMTPAYAWHRDVLRLIQSTCNERRWVLKYPSHLTHLEVLLATYPDARIVMTHRDPARVLPSLCSLVTNWRSIYEDDVDVQAVARWQVAMWERRIAHAMAVRDQVGDERFFDLPFHEIVDDPVEAIRRIYTRFGETLSPEAEHAIRAWNTAHPRNRHGGHDYTAQAFGIDPADISYRFEPYRRRFDIPTE